MLQIVKKKVFLSLCTVPIVSMLLDALGLGLLGCTGQTQVVQSGQQVLAAAACMLLASGA